MKSRVNLAFSSETSLAADCHHLSPFTKKNCFSFSTCMRSGHVWTSISMTPLLEPCLILSCSFYLSKQNDFVFFHAEEMIQGQSISQECKNWMWEISWKFSGHLCATVNPRDTLVAEWDVTFDVALDRDAKEASHGLFSIAFAFEETHAGVKPPQSSSETLPAPGVGRRCCSAARRDSELMGLSPSCCSRSVLTYFTLSVWKPKVVSLSPRRGWWWRISADKVAQSHCWVCWGLSMPGPVPCHHKSLLKIYGCYLSPSVCVCALR